MDTYFNVFFYGEIIVHWLNALVVILKIDILSNAQYPLKAEQCDCYILK